MKALLRNLHSRQQAGGVLKVHATEGILSLTTSMVVHNDDSLIIGQSEIAKAG